MARQLRIQYPGALYHVVNRGNYRQDLFSDSGSASSFISTLEECGEMYGWKLHAYVLMRNHYHLVMETPQPNLVEGMHWLQGTFGIRFNRFQNERGHLFQGRYHSGLIEDRKVLGHVVDYVHLNPVRAGLLSGANAVAYSWSSLRAFVQGRRLSCLDPRGCLAIYGLADDPQGWRKYQSHLSELAANQAEQKRLGWDGFSYGWAHGSESWRKALAKEHARSMISSGLESVQLRELKESQWGKFLDLALRASDRSRAELLESKFSDAWKLELADGLRSAHGIPISWLALNLHLGAPSSARSLLSRVRRKANGVRARIVDLRANQQFSP